MKLFFASTLILSLATLVVLVAETPGKGMAIGTAIAAMVFGGLLATYIIIRDGQPQLERYSELNDKLVTDKLELLNEYANDTDDETI